MKYLQSYDYKGTQLEFEIIDGQVFANATEMCQVFGKEIRMWSRLESTGRFVEAVVQKMHIAHSQLIIAKKGGENGGGKTWIHEKLILKLAQWLDVDFEIWCNEKLAELIRTGTTSIKKPLSYAEMFLQNAQILVEHENRIGVVEQKQIETDDKILQLESKIVTRPSYFTVMGYAVIRKMHLTPKRALSLGKAASQMCRDKGFETDKVRDDRYGHVNSYPEVILKEVFK
jgi:KilA-N domain